MFKKILFFSLLVFSLFVSQSFAGHASPCFSSYKQQYKYDFRPEGMMYGWKEVLKGWGIAKQWGLKENVTFISNNPKNPRDLVMRVFFPKDSINPSNRYFPRGGAGFYAKAKFPHSATRACLRYRVYFPKDFEFAKGGKLPGLYGGKAAFGCKNNSEYYGFSARYMWRRDGRGTSYLYSPYKKDSCGELVGLGEWSFKAGRWHVLEQEIKLNNGDAQDGVFRVWVNGKNVINREDVVFRLSPNIFIEGLMFNSFFGGGDESWASPKDQFILFDDFMVAFP